MEKMKMETANIAAQNVEKIEALFPNCVTEALDEEKSTDEKKDYKKVINFDMLRQMLSEQALDGDEAYEFTWVGKKAAMRNYREQMGFIRKLHCLRHGIASLQIA